MGRLKQLLPWPPGASADGSTVVESSFDAIAPHCDEMIVVVGAEAAVVAGALGPRRFRIVQADPDAEMFHSVRAGLVEARQCAGVAAAVVHPADQPAVRSQTVRMLLHEQQARPNRAVMPEFGGRGGHPVVIPTSLFDAILAFENDGGLREFWRQRPQRCLRVEVLDPGVRLDLDHPEDYRTAGVDKM